MTQKTEQSQSRGFDRLVLSYRRASPRRSWLAAVLDRRIARAADRLVVNSAAVRNLLVNRHLPVEKIRVIADGVAPCRPTSTTRRQLLSELGLPEGSRLIAVVGRLARRRRIKDAIWAADLLKVIRDDIHLLVIGDGPHRARLRTFRDQVVIRDKVRFLGRRRDTPRILPHCDALWSPEAFGNPSGAVLQAMAAGVPVVATDIPVTRELVIAESTGYLIPVGDRAALARHTQRLLEDPDLARRLGRGGQDRVAAEFTVEKMVQRHAELYRELLE
jgi:glycosyltransferase involved in cell wall biosynthesis